jgi:F420-dependent oxidoreductase-like protein
VERVRRAEQLGYDGVFTTQLPQARDTTVLMAAYGAATTRLALATHVLPIYQRHPTAMAAAAATLAELTGGRFRLGIGVAHQRTVEDMWGLSIEKPATAMREYATIVRTILEEGAVSFQGRRFSANSVYTAPRPPVPIYIAALSPRMLELAGELGDGVSLWLCSPEYVERVVLPHVTRGRERAGKPLEGFEIVASVPVFLTTGLEAARGAFRQTLATYAALPFYRRMLEASGFAEDLGSGRFKDSSLDSLAAFGGPEAAAGLIARYRAAGATLPVLGPSTAPGTQSFESQMEALSGA